tara:strand:- start:15231 stop:17858 length:2628 start_codon:yes stop_codon:yes gene_type:complete
MAELSDILLFLSQQIRDTREEKQDEADRMLAMLQMDLNAQSKVLGSQLSHEQRKEFELQETFNQKNQEFANITGVLNSLDDYDASNSIQLLDNVKSPILDTYESEINNIKTKNANLSSAIQQIDKKLQVVNKVKEHFTGEGLTFKGGMSDERWDYGDFGYDEKSKTWDDAKLKLALNLKADEKIPDYIENTITQGRAGIDTTLVELNQTLDSAILEGLRVKKENYATKDLDDPSFNTAEYINDLHVGITAILDPIVGSIATSNLAPLRRQIMELSDLEASYDLTDEGAIEFIQGAREDVDEQKIKLAQGFTGLLGDDNNAVNLAFANKLILGVESYYSSMIEGDDLRNAIPFIDALEEIYFYQVGHEKGMTTFLNKVQQNNLGMDYKGWPEDIQKEYNKIIGDFGSFQDMVVEFTKWDWDTYKERISTLMSVGEDIKDESILFLNQKIGERDKDIEKFEDEQKIELKLKQSQSASSPVIGDTDYEHGIDYSKALYYDVLKEEHGIDTNADGIIDALDMNKDGIPDPIVSNAPENVKEDSPAYVYAPKSSPNYELTEDQHIVNDDYIYDKNSNYEHGILRDYDGKLVRVVTDPREKLYFEYTGSKEGNFKVKSGSSMDTQDWVINQYDQVIDTLYDMPNDMWAAVIPTLSVTYNAHQKNVKSASWGGVVTGAGDMRYGYSVKSDPQKIKIILNSMWDGTVKRNEYNYGIEGVHLSSHIQLDGYNKPIKRENWSIFNAMGGGHMFHDNSPYYEAYYDVLRLEWNNLIDQDGSVWFPNFWKESEFGETVGVNPDQQYVQLIKDHYPGSWDKINKIADEIASDVQYRYIDGIMNYNAGAADKKYTISNGEVYSSGEYDFNEKDKYDIVRALAQHYGIDF